MHCPKIRFNVGDEKLVGQFFLNNLDDAPKILFLHGAGKAKKEKVYSLALRLLNGNISSFCFDFSGHGESTGNLNESSLYKRVLEAQAALTFVNPQNQKTVCAFSMGGHIALELLRDNPIDNLILFSPAIYTSEAYRVPFDERFSGIIRQKDSWKNADVVNSLHNFRGKLLIIYGEKDKVIPRGVIDILDRESTFVLRKEILILPNIGHQILETASKNIELMNLIYKKCVYYSQ
jgi:hypothetical protein